MASMERIFDFFSKIPSISFGLSDIADIALVAFVLYKGIKLIRETRAFQILKGLILLAVVFFFVYEFNMQASTYIFRFIFSNIVFLLIVIFQQEIRQIVERMGSSGTGFFKSVLKISGNVADENVNNAIIEICKAVQKMSNEKIGSLIVMEKNTPLSDVLKTGTEVDAKISEELMGNIFYPKSPLHDGAAIVRDGRLLSAGCVLPLTKNNSDVASELGTRHRAAIGVSESSDAMAVVVSEETGGISVAVGGNLTRNLNESELREKLMDYLAPTSSSNGQNEKSGIRKFVKGLKK